MGVEDQLRKIVGERLKKDEPLAKHTNLRIGGPADLLVEVRDEKEALKVFQRLIASGTEYFIIGGGSNVLVSDNGIRGVVVKMAMRDFNIKGGKVMAEAGVLSALLARETVEAGLSGFGWAVGLPGTIGGAVRGNAGCFGSEIGSLVKTVYVLNIKDSRVKREKWDSKKCEFGYRDSVFKRLGNSVLVLSMILQLEKGDLEAERKKMKEIIEQRKAKQPLGRSSAGCIFKNVSIKSGVDLERLMRDTDVPQEFIDNDLIPAGWLIEQAGLKNFRIGDAQVSEKHANFIVNVGQATADHVVQLIATIKSRVRALYGLELMDEIQYIGFNQDSPIPT